MLAAALLISGGSAVLAQEPDPEPVPAPPSIEVSVDCDANPLKLRSVGS